MCCEIGCLWKAFVAIRTAEIRIFHFQFKKRKNVRKEEKVRLISEKNQLKCSEQKVHIKNHPNQSAIPKMWNKSKLFLQKEKFGSFWCCNLMAGIFSCRNYYSKYFNFWEFERCVTVNLCTTDMDVRRNGCEGVFSGCSVGRRFSRKVYINLALIPIECNHYYLHLQSLNLAYFWHFLKWFGCLGATMGSVAVNRSYCCSNKMVAVAVRTVTFYWNRWLNSFVVDFESAVENRP